jgi:hypothetical protein
MLLECFESIEDRRILELSDVDVCVSLVDYFILRVDWIGKHYQDGGIALCSHDYSHEPHEVIIMAWCVPMHSILLGVFSRICYLEVIKVIY